MWLSLLCLGIVRARVLPMILSFLQTTLFDTRQVALSNIFVVQHSQLLQANVQGSLLSTTSDNRIA